MLQRRNRKMRIIGDNDPGKLVVLGLCATLVSFAGFNLMGSGDAPVVAREAAPGPKVKTVARAPKPAPVRVAAKPKPAVRKVAPPSVEVPQFALEKRNVMARPEETPGAPKPFFREIEHRIQPGETISEVFEAYDISRAEAANWINATRKVYNLNSVFVGQRVTIVVDNRSQKVLSLQVEIDPQTNLVAKRENDQVVAEREAVVLDRNLRVVKGRVATSFYTAAADADVPDRIISQVADILGWDINFATDLVPGAEFKIVYEELERAEGTRKIAGRVVAVQIEGRRKLHEGILHVKEGDTRAGYYSRKGESLGRDFLRYPVAFTRISSHFSSGRYHPVLKRKRPHHGVDFAAPTGTPIRAVSDGKVVMSGWHGGNGRFVKIRHDDIYQSGYSHLSRIDSRAKEGTFVKKGQVIGYVGASGLATGPHLHFAMYKNDDYINPLSESMPRSKSLTGPVLETFLAKVKAVDAAYAKAEPTGSATLVAKADIELP